MVYTLYNILKYEIIYKKKKANQERKAKQLTGTKAAVIDDEDEQIASFGNSEFGNIRKKLLTLITQLRSSLQMKDFLNHKYFKELKERRP